MRSLRGDRGAAVVEFALIVPVLILIVFAAIDIGLFVFAKSQASNAARDGSRVAMINPGTPGTYSEASAMTPATQRIFDAAVRRLGSVPTGLSVTVSCDPDPCAVAPDSNVLVSVQWHRDPLTFVIEPVVGDNVAATSTRSLIGIP